MKIVFLSQQCIRVMNNARNHAYGDDHYGCEIEVWWKIKEGLCFNVFYSMGRQQGTTEHSWLCVLRIDKVAAILGFVLIIDATFEGAPKVFFIFDIISDV